MLRAAMSADGCKRICPLTYDEMTYDERGGTSATKLTWPFPDV